MRKHFLPILLLVTLICAALLFAACDNNDTPKDPQQTQDSQGTLPTEKPTESHPTENPTESQPTEAPTGSQPTEIPTESQPTEAPTETPTESPTEKPQDCNHVEVIDGAVAPTCEKEGLTEGKHCSLCGEILIAQEVVEKIPHALTEVTEKQPTCTEDGHNAYKYCANCNYTTIEIIPAAHSIAQVGEKSATCTEDGHNAYEYCTSCDYTTIEIIPAAHNLAYEEEKSATCTEDGHNTYEYCTTCDYTTIEIIPAAHNLEYVSEKSATCTENGHNAYEYCTNCDYTTFVIAPPLDHTLVYVDEKPSTCSEAGHAAYEYCSVCDYTTIVPLPLMEHTLIFMAKKDPTCMAEGHSPYEYCASCTYTTYMPVPKVPHQYSDEWTADVLATPEQNGVVSRHCIYSETEGCGMRTDVTEYAYEYYTEGLCFTLLSSGTYMVSVGEAVGKDIIIPKTYLGIPVTVIGDFTGGIKSISIPEGITEIAGGAFYHGKIESGRIELPDSLKSIGGFAFGSSVWSVDFGNAVPVFDYTTFGNVLHEVYVSSFENWYQIFDNYYYGIFQFGGHLYVNGTLVEGHVTIPDGYTEVPAHAFENQLHVTSITIPSSVRTISSGALKNSGITDIYFEGTPEQWATMMFYSDINWEIGRLHISGIAEEGHVILPNGCTVVPDHLFQNKPEVTAVTIPASVQKINAGAFENSGVSDIYFEGTLEQWCGVTIIGSGVIDAWDGITLHINGTPLQGELSIPETVTEIGAYTFANQAITKLYLHTGVLAIGDHAFSGTLINQNLLLHEGLEAIGEKAFYGTKLHAVSLPSTLTVIGEAAFSSDVSVLYYYCTNAVIEGRISCILLHVGAEVESIPDHAFNPHYVAFAENSRLISIGSGAFHSFFLATICLPDSVTEIAEDAFAGCTNLGSAYCPSHATLLLPDSPNAVIGSTLLPSEDGFYFMEADGAYYLVAMPTDLSGHVTLPTYATETAGYTVHAIPYLPGVTGLTSPKSATLACFGNLGEYLPDLTTLIINGTLECNLGTLDKLEHLELLGDEGRPGYGGTALRYLVLGGQETEIPAGAFDNCTALETVILLDGIERIEGGAFKNCISLRYLLVPDSVTYLGWDVVSEWTRIGLSHTDLDGGFFGSYYEYNVKEYYFTGTEFGYIDHEGQTHVLPIVELPTEPEEDDSVTETPGDPPAEMLPGAYVQDDVHCYDIDFDGNYVYCGYLGEIENGVLVLPETLDGHEYTISIGTFYQYEGLVEIVVPRAVVRIRPSQFVEGQRLERIVFEDTENWRWNASMNPRAHWTRCAECSAWILQSDLLVAHSMFHSSLLTH